MVSESVRNQDNPEEHSALILWLTFLQHLQVLPEDVAGEGGRLDEERVLAHGEDVLAAHVELLQVDAVQRELPDSPAQPVSHVVFRPLSRVCNNQHNA